jgi:hypothetical protein
MDGSVSRSVFASMRALAILSLLLLLLSCNGRSPTEPATNPSLLTGTWVGNLGEQYPSGEDWTSVTIELTQNGAAVEGTLRERGGRVHPLSGHFEGPGGGVTVTDIATLGQNGCSSAAMVIGGVDVDQTGRAISIHGSMAGKCYGTMLASFRLNRAA